MSIYHLYDLPREILYHILIYLSYRELLKFRQVSTLFRSIINDYYFWFQKAKLEFQQYIFLFDLNQSGNLQYLKLLSLQNCDIGSEHFIEIETCLTRAILKNDSYLINYFLSLSLRNNNIKDWDSILELSINRKQDDLIYLIIKISQDYYRNLLIEALRRKSLDFFYFLDCQGISYRWNALRKAIQQDNSKIIKLLLKKGTLYSSSLLSGIHFFWPECSLLDDLIDYRSHILTKAIRLANQLEKSLIHLILEHELTKFHESIILACKEFPNRFN